MHHTHIFNYLKFYSKFLKQDYKNFKHISLIVNNDETKEN